MVQAETLNMMSKYQLVFVKIENVFHKVANTNRIREREMVFEAFRRIERCAVGRRLESGYRVQMIAIKLRKKYIARIVSTYERKITRLQHLAFN